MPKIRPLSAALAKKAAEELNEVPENIQADLDALKDWIKKCPHLRARTDDQFLVTFLRGCKYSLEKAKQKLDLFYTTRTFMPELVIKRDPTQDPLQALVRLGIGLPLPVTEHPDSPRVILIRPGAYDASKFTLLDVFKYNTLIHDVLINEDDNLIIAGQIGILDCSNVTMAHFLQFNPTFIKKVMVMSQDASPFRQKGFHFVNTPYGFESVFNLFKTFINEKNRSRLYVHGNNFDSLYKVIPRRLLPSEYGGEAGPIQTIIDDWEKRIVSFRKYYKEDEKFGTDEKYRQGPPKVESSLFGIQGSFRQLNVD